MTEKKEIQVTPPANLTPMEMIQVAFNKAIEQGGALEVVDRILEQQKWMIQHSEEEAFNAALKRIQSQMKKIAKRGWNPQTKSWFATAEDIDDEIQALLDSEGMTLSFRPEATNDANMVLIVGTLSLGAYSKEYPLPMPTDGQGAKGGGVMTRTHATGSAITYAKRYLKNMIFDLRFEEHDDDGNAAGMAQGMADDHLNGIKNAETSIAVMEAWTHAINAAKKFTPIDYRAMTVFTEARDERLKAMRRGK